MLHPFTGRRRATGLLTALLLLVPAAVLSTASPSSAETCDPYNYYGKSASFASVRFQWAPECSDGVAKLWYGELTDTACDNRSARVWFEVWDRQASGTWVRLARSPNYNVTTGCGQSATFPTWRPPSPGTTGWKLTTYLTACSWNCLTPVSFENVG